ncbi:MAG: DUF1549 domain-containing protein, partial [Planctomycetota bacterium]|nr:DUF1549 domain-containing protein [Planctomycetota bacterium]MEC9115610.1 DUF1549 domain-containing protein [Planctomycetota bacterium]
MSNLFKNLGFVTFGVVGLFLLMHWVVPRERVTTLTWEESATNRRPDELELVVEEINAEFEKSWDDKNLQRAPDAESMSLIRRVSLGLTGTIPSLEEIRKIQEMPESQRVNWWLNYILEDERFADYFAER